MSTSKLYFMEIRYVNEIRQITDEKKQQNEDKILRCFTAGELGDNFWNIQRKLTDSALDRSQI